MKKTLGILGWIGTGTLSALILLVGFMFLGPRFGWETHSVLSGSMEPTLKVGGIIVTKPEKLDNIQVGDIITFQPKEQRVTHRVINISLIDGKPWFQTKGDANEEPDPNFVSSEKGKIAKVIFHLPYFGYLATFMKSELVFLILVGIPALILIGIFSNDVWKGISEEREKRRLRVINLNRKDREKQQF